MNQSGFYRKFSGTAGFLFGSRALTIILGVIYARYLGPEQFGLFSYVMAIVTVLTIPVVAGLPNLLIREISQFQLEKKWALLAGVLNWSRVYVVVISISIIIFTELCRYLGFFSEAESNLLWFAVILVPLKGILGRQGAILNGFRFPALAQLPLQIFVPIITLIILSFSILTDTALTAKSLIIISILAFFLAVVISDRLLEKTTKPAMKIVPANYAYRSWYKSLLPFSLITIFTTLNTEITSVLLGWWINNESVGYFKVAMQAVGLISLGLSSVNAVIMPNVARLHKQNDIQGAQLLLTKSVRLSALISLPIICCLIIFGEFAISVLFGNDYLAAYPVLVFLCFGQLVNVLMGSVGLVLNMVGYEKYTLKSLSITFVVNVLLLYTLVPVFGVLGAAFSVSACMILWNVLMAIDVKRLTGLRTWIR